MIDGNTINGRFTSTTEFPESARAFPENSSTQGPKTEDMPENLPDDGMEITTEGICNLYMFISGDSKRSITPLHMDMCNLIILFQVAPHQILSNADF